MTNGQIQQLQDLSKCYMPRREHYFCVEMEQRERLNKWQKRHLQTLTHQYRNQIAAIKRNQQRAIC